MPAMAADCLRNTLTSDGRQVMAAAAVLESCQRDLHMHVQYVETLHTKTSAVAQ